MVKELYDVKKKKTQKVAKELNKEEFGKIIKEAYIKINKVLKKYCDLKPSYYNLVSLWIIGTHFHKSFTTYPYLFFNAMKGSGKTRILNIISHLSKGGKLITNISEAVLFRTAKHSTFCIDEFERIGSKEKAILRELLNSAYKFGITVERLKKLKSEGSEKYVVEKFDMFCPISMANIWGMENVLADRCIPLTLEKSQNKRITRILENFEFDDDFQAIKDVVSVVCVMLSLQNIYKQLIKGWNAYIIRYYNDTNDTHYTHNINDTNDTLFYRKIADTSLDSRDLELFFPLFIISSEISGDVLDETIQTAEEIVKERKEEDVYENRDISLIDFLAKQEPINDFISLSNILKEFKEFLKESEEETKWINSRWLGKALKRLALIKEKRRLGEGREVIINYKKARQKIIMFKDVEETQKNLKIEEIKL